MDSHLSASPTTSEIYSRHNSACEIQNTKGGGYLVLMGLPAAWGSGQSSPPHRRIKLSGQFKRLLGVATFFPLLALVFIAFSTVSPQWERVEFEFKEMLQQFACTSSSSTGAVTNPHHDKRNWSLAYMILVDGQRIQLDAETLLNKEPCRRFLRGGGGGGGGGVKPGLVEPSRDVNSIVGMGIFVGERNETAHSEITTLSEIYNILGGVFRACYEIKGMQNNVIACTIVVFLCVLSSLVVGAVSVYAHVVPAALVNAFLYLTASVFITFANCIQHIKLSHIQSKWGPCYPISNLPSELYNPRFISAYCGWAVYLNWTAVGIFLLSSCSWFFLKRLLNVETSKSLI